MKLDVLDAHETADGLSVTFMTESGLYELIGSLEEMGRLAAMMRQVAVLATLHEGEGVWLEDVPVGEAIVRLGLNPGGTTRLLIVRGCESP